MKHTKVYFYKIVEMNAICYIFTIRGVSDNVSIMILVFRFMHSTYDDDTFFKNIPHNVLCGH